jgi:uncharacterized membrane protein
MTMIIVFAVIGLILGAMTGSFAGALAGAALGYAIGVHVGLKSRIEELEEKLARVARRASVEPADEQKGWDVPGKAAAREVPPAVTGAATPIFSPAPTPAAIPTAAAAPAAEAEAWKKWTEAAGTPDAEPQARREFLPPEFPPVFAWIRDYFTGGNMVVRTGIIVLFFGVAFLLKFAADRNLMPIEFRVAGVALGGAVLLAIGWRLRLRVRPYALALQGGGVGLLYLTAFAALRLYDLLPPTLTFALLVVVAALSAFLAIGQNSPALILLGITGGFLAPVLASTGQGNHVVLFSYYALLNAGIVAIAWFKAWRGLNLLAFIFTFGIGSAWGVLKYRPEHFASTEPFLVLFFLMFVAIAVLFALRTAPRLGDYVDGTLVFGTPVMTMMLQAGLVHDRPYAMAFSSLTLSAVYLALTALVWRLRREQMRMLAMAFLALGVAFLTLAVPLALDGHWTAATWALEGAAILWIGLRQDRKLAIASGVLLQIGAALSFALRHDVRDGGMVLANSRFLGALFIAIAAMVSARLLASSRERLGGDLRWIAAVPVYWALFWWSVAVIGELHDYLPDAHLWPALLTLGTVTALGCAALSRWDNWQELRPPTMLLLPVMVLAGFALVDSEHLLAGWGAAAWPLAIASWIWLLHWREKTGASPIETGLHVASLWLFVILASIELWWQTDNARVGDDAWRVVMSALPAIVAMAGILYGAYSARWPVTSWPVAYAGVGAAGIAAYLFAWVLCANVMDGGAQPLPYLPIINPIEITQGLALAAVAGWILYLKCAAPERWRAFDGERLLWPAFAFAVFTLLTAMLLRLLHHYTGVSYQPGALMRSTTVQASLSIFWGLLALTGMVIGARWRERLVWFTAAALLGVVLLKMFLVDLSRTGTVARIVSFIGVGILMLIIGRFSPVPPAKQEAGESK